LEERTGLPPSVEDEDLSDSESEEADEADEDSNGWCRDLDRDVVLMFFHEPSQPKSITRTTIPTRKILIVTTVACNFLVEYQPI